MGATERKAAAQAKRSCLQRTCDESLDTMNGEECKMVDDVADDEEEESMGL